MSDYLWLPVLAALFGVLTAALAWRKRNLLSATRAHTRQEVSKAAEAQRFMHLAGLDLRAPAMSLIGYADQLTHSNAASGGHATGIASIAGQLLRLEQFPSIQSRIVNCPTRA